MKRKVEILKGFISGFLLLVVLLFSADLSFGQCGTYFKTNYRKIINGFSDYKLDDWTGDGRLDFWTFQTNPNTLKQDVVIYPSVGNNDWNWANPIISTTEIPRYQQFADKYSLIDWDSDGDKDIFFEYAGTYYTVYQNNNNGTFSTLTTQFSETHVFYTVGFFDINGDNLLDWINVANAPGQGHSIGYLLSTANGTFAQRVNLIASVSLINTGGSLGDFNGDGRIDILSALGVLRNNGGGSFTLGSQAPGGETADFNNDGKTDILVAISPTTNPDTPRRIRIYYGQSDGSFNSVEYPVFNPSSYNSDGVKIGDFNGDNKPDFIETYNRSYSPIVPFYSIFINNGAGGFTRTDYNRELGAFQNLVFSDFSGDGKTDIFVRQLDSTLIGNIFGEQVIIIQYNQCESFGAVKGQNFDGNYRDDLVLWNPNTGNWLNKNGDWYGSESYGVFNWGLGSLGDVPAPGDFDGDGKTDYSVYRNSTGTWYIRQSSNSAWYVFKFGLSGDIAVPNDYDGGGKTDIAVFRPSDGNWYIWSSETQQFSALHFGTNGDNPVPQDYDGDGKTDVAVYRPSEGNWYYLKSSDGNYAVIRWGISTDKPIPADYDGDGKADVAVYRGGTWYILRSYNNLPGYFPQGNNGDIPVSFYDNKEIAIPVSYRPFEGKWYRYFGAGVQGLFFGGNQYKPIYFGLPNN